ncbi:DNA repair protein rhp54 [Hordeum vulgare]|nr:DNA repair protein rhp54 [Hordeum vulgare]
MKQEVTNVRVAAATRDALYMLWLNPSQHDLVNVAVAAANTGSSAFPRMVLPDSPRVSACTPMSGFHVYPQTSRLSRECSPEVSVVAPSTSAPAPINLNATPVVGGSSFGGARRSARQMPADVLSGACNLFDGMLAADDKDYMQNLIFEDGAPAAGYDPDETQSQDGRGAFTPSTFDQDQAAFMRHQVHRACSFISRPKDMNKHSFPRPKSSGRLGRAYWLEDEAAISLAGQATPAG